MRNFKTRLQSVTFTVILVECLDRGVFVACGVQKGTESSQIKRSIVQGHVVIITRAERARGAAVSE